MTNGHLVALPHGDVGGVYKKVLQNLLHTGHLLLHRSENKRWDARSLHEFLSQVRLELLEVLVGRFGDAPQILSEGLCMLREKPFVLCSTWSSIQCPQTQQQTLVCSSVTVPDLCTDPQVSKDRLCQKPDDTQAPRSSSGTETNVANQSSPADPS